MNPDNELEQDQDLVTHRHENSGGISNEGRNKVCGWESAKAVVLSALLLPYALLVWLFIHNLRDPVKFFGYVYGLVSPSILLPLITLELTILAAAFMEVKLVFPALVTVPLSVGRRVRILHGAGYTLLGAIMALCLTVMADGWMGSDPKPFSAVLPGALIGWIYSNNVNTNTFCSPPILPKFLREKSELLGISFTAINTVIFSTLCSEIFYVLTRVSLLYAEEEIELSVGMVWRLVDVSFTGITICAILAVIPRVTKEIVSTKQRNIGTNFQEVEQDRVETVHNRQGISATAPNVNRGPSKAPKVLVCEDRSCVTRLDDGYKRHLVFPAVRPDCDKVMHDLTGLDETPNLFLIARDNRLELGINKNTIELLSGVFEEFFDTENKGKDQKKDIKDLIRRGSANTLYVKMPYDILEVLTSYMTYHVLSYYVDQEVDLFSWIRKLKLEVLVEAIDLVK